MFGEIMASKKAKSDSGHSESFGSSKRARSHSLTRNSARSAFSIDAYEPGDDLSVTGSSVEPPGTKGPRSIKDSGSAVKKKQTHNVSSMKTTVGVKPLATGFSSFNLHSAKVSDRRNKTQSKTKPKPAWFAFPNDTPRSDVSEIPSTVHPKPSLADFLNLEDQNGQHLKGIPKHSAENAIQNQPRQHAASEDLSTESLNKEHGSFRGDVESPLVDSIGNFRVGKELRADFVDPSKEPVKSIIRTEGVENKTDDCLLEERDLSARKIQSWYRRLRNRKKAGRAALKRLMDSKKQQLETALSTEKEIVQKEQALYDLDNQKRKRREEKARQARMAAIEELRNKRESGTQQKKPKGKGEMVFLQSSGKIAKEPYKANINNKLTKPYVNKLTPDFSEVKEANLDMRPSTSSSVGRKLNEIFEDSKSRSSKAEGYDEDDDKSEKSNEESTVTLKGSKSTFDDLMNTLKELEHEPAGNINISASQNQAFRENVETRQSMMSSQSDTLLQRQEIQQNIPGPLLSADKLQTIMNFLDEVEKAEEDIRSEVTRQSKESFVRESFPAWNEGHFIQDKEITPNDSASQVATEISNAIAAQKQELDQKNQSLNMLQKALEQHREFSSVHVQELEKEHKQQLALQRKEYESTIQRHLSFIDQLIDDKKALSSRCEQLVKKLKETDEKYTSKIKKMEDDHGVEIKKQKEMLEAAEKLRREKWMQEKTKQIKEMTVKGLEPDIQRLIAKHKADIKRLKAAHQGELLESDERAGRKYIRQIEEMRERLEQEKDLAVQKEREIAKQRFEKQLEQEEENYQQQRRRLHVEVQDEKERIGRQIQAMRDELREEKDAVEVSCKQNMLKLQEEHQKTIEEMDRRHTTEVNNLKEQLEIEKQQWIENHMKKQEVYLLSKERELKESVRDSRDKEIEMVIQRLEEETARSREESNRAAENRIKRIVDKYENELKELERSEKLTQEKYNKLKAQTADQESEELRLKSQLKQRDQEIQDIKRITDQLQLERGKVSDIIRQEFADRLVTLDEDNKRLRTDISELRARHRLEIDRISAEKEQEMEEVHKRVKQAVAKKEETTNLLKQQMKAAEKRAEHLEMLLAEQRKKLMS